jgi:hypothetical protein
MVTMVDIAVLWYERVKRGRRERKKGR